MALPALPFGTIAKIQIQHLLKLNVKYGITNTRRNFIQIQHLLKLNCSFFSPLLLYSIIQIQHLLKLNKSYGVF